MRWCDVVEFWTWVYQQLAIYSAIKNRCCGMAYSLCPMQEQKQWTPSELLYKYYLINNTKHISYIIKSLSWLVLGFCIHSFLSNEVENHTIFLLWIVLNLLPLLSSIHFFHLEVWLLLIFFQSRARLIALGLFLEIISYLFSFPIVLFLYDLKIANLSFIQNLHVQTILCSVQNLANSVDFSLQLTKHQRIQSLIPNQIVDVDCIFLPNSVRSVFGLHEHSRSPVQFSEDDGGGSGESKTCAHGSDA